MEAIEQKTNNELILIPKTEKYMQYMLDLLLKLPRTEKFSIGTEYKSSMYRMLTNLMYLNKLSNGKQLEYVNLIDAELQIQRIYARLMNTNRWIDDKKFKVVTDQIHELGKIVGGLTKYYAKNNKKSI